MPPRQRPAAAEPRDQDHGQHGREQHAQGPEQHGAVRQLYARNSEWNQQHHSRGRSDALPKHDALHDALPQPDAPPDAQPQQDAF
eukprot:8611733-Pyramimonas_sp.AAC.1